MTDFQINDADLSGFKGKVAIITGIFGHKKIIRALD
jgi:hypothetical protein